MKKDLFFISSLTLQRRLERWHGHVFTEGLLLLFADVWGDSVSVFAGLHAPPWQGFLFHTGHKRDKC